MKLLWLYGLLVQGPGQPKKRHPLTSKDTLLIFPVPLTKEAIWKHSRQTSSTEKVSLLRRKQLQASLPYFTLLKESNNKSNISYIPLLGSNKEASVRYQHFFIAIPINQKNETLLFSQENTLSEASASSVPTMAYKDMSAGILKLHFLSFAK